MRCMPVMTPVYEVGYTGVRVLVSSCTAPALMDGTRLGTCSAPEALDDPERPAGTTRCHGHYVHRLRGTRN